jgi:hypothetical protein
MPDNGCVSTKNPLLDGRAGEIQALSENNHDDASGELCAVEYVNLVAGQAHSDRGNSVISEVLAAFAREANDHSEAFRRAAMQHGHSRQPMILAMLNTAGDLGVERARAMYFVNRAVRAAALALVDGGLHDEADRLRDLPPATNRDTAEALYGACVQINMAHVEDLPRRYKTHVVAAAAQAARHASHYDEALHNYAAAAKAAYDAIDPDHKDGDMALEVLIEACAIAG